jgi:hypothetical protein
MAGNDRKLFILQDRDVHLLRELAVMRVIDREQAKVVAGFHSTTRANARLLALTNAGFLRRFFWGSVGGARKALYALSLRGAQIAGVSYRRPRRGQNQVLAADSLAAHQLGINEIYCVLKYPLVPDRTVKFLHWTCFQEPLTGTALIPDGYAEIEVPAKVVALFFEVDLGSESRSVWDKKVQAYLSYAASGNFAAQFGQPQFRTLVIANSEARLRALRAATAALTAKVFRFTTFERVRREGFWSGIWQRLTGDARETLI